MPAAGPGIDQSVNQITQALLGKSGLSPGDRCPAQG